MADWRVLTADLVSGSLKGEIPLEGFKFGRVLSGASSWSSTIGQDHPKATLSNLDPARTAVYLERGNRVLWGGILWPFRRGMGSREIQVAASDWVDWLDHRTIRATLDFDQEDQLQIVRDIVAQLQNIQDLGITVDSGNSGVLRDRTYHGYERQGAGKVIGELAHVIDGFEYRADTTRDNETDTITRRIRLGYPRLGRRTNHVFQWGVNIEDYGYSKDGGRVENQVDGIGAGIEADKLIVTATDPNLWDSYPILDGVESRESVTQTSTLQGHAATRLKERRHPLELVDVKLKANAFPSFSSWVPGDEVRVVIDDKAVQVDGFMRAISDSVDVSKTGDETVTVKLQPLGVTL